jgi:hypothetical protein
MQPRGLAQGLGPGALEAGKIEPKFKTARTPLIGCAQIRRLALGQADTHSRF